MSQLEEDLDFLNRQLQAYTHMRRVRELTIEMANKDITDIDSLLERINNKIKELENVQGSVHTIQTISQGSNSE